MRQKLHRITKHLVSSLYQIGQTQRNHGVVLESLYRKSKLQAEENCFELRRRRCRQFQDRRPLKMIVLTALFLTLFMMSSNNREGRSQQREHTPRTVYALTGGATNFLKERKINERIKVSSMSSSIKRRGMLQPQQVRIRGQYRSKLNMVLTTPESIIEQASTVNLLDELIDESVCTSPRRPIMMQFDPSSGWIWRRWKGTVFAETRTSCARNMLFSLAVYLVHRSYPNMFKNYLSGFSTLWGQLLSVTTFTLTFFVNQSYSLWRKCMELSRRLQG